MMRNILVLLSVATVVLVIGCSKRAPENQVQDNTTPTVPNDLILIKGGTFINQKSNLYGKGASIADFYMGKYEVTQQEWTKLMGTNPSKFQGDNLPVETVSWYDCVEYCNQRSLKEGLNPYYNIDKHKKDQRNKAEMDDMKWTVTVNAQANGYRLPTEAEWEYAAGGGQASKSLKYSGSDHIDDVAWYWQNSGDKPLTGIWSKTAIENNHNKTKAVGSKNPNELGLYDMSGNVREWCEDWYEDKGTDLGLLRVWRGGGWMGADFCCEPSFRTGYQANGKGADQGFRICRSK